MTRRLSKLVQRYEPMVRIKKYTLSYIIGMFYKPVDPSSLAVTRMLFGIIMLIDIIEERGGSELDIRWGHPYDCHFPLFQFIQPMSLPYMAVTYALMWLGALGIALGYKYRSSCIMFTVPYWYILLIEKSYWNNHSYLYGLLAILLSGTQANTYLSLDSYFDPSIKHESVPYWNYFIIKYQLFILYFVAGLKKCNVEWLSGYAMIDLNQHWMFSPFKLFLTPEQTDYIMVHWFACLFDLSIVPLMIWEKTRYIASMFCAAFHLMNINIFHIGMFPLVCLATMPLFFPHDWPKQLFNTNKTKNKTLIEPVYEENHNNNMSKLKVSKVCGKRKCLIKKSTQAKEKTNTPKLRQIYVTFTIFAYIILQAFLPYSHFITQGYNNWTHGLYGYSWDMMVHTWKSALVFVKVVNNENKREMYVDPDIWVPNDRWTRHSDMVVQYSHCIERNIINGIKSSKNMKSNHGENILTEKKNFKRAPLHNLISENISIYVDVWYSMNGRFQQRMYNPEVDLLKVKWSPFKRVDWLMPLIPEQILWRETINEITDDINMRNNFTDLLFIADFPGLKFNNYISEELENVTLTLLEGRTLITHDTNNKSSNLKPNNNLDCNYLRKGEHLIMNSGEFHSVRVISETPAFYYYTFMNKSRVLSEDIYKPKVKTRCSLMREFKTRLNNLVIFVSFIWNSLKHIFLGNPMLIRIKYI